MLPVLVGSDTGGGGEIMCRWGGDYCAAQDRGV